MRPNRREFVKLTAAALPLITSGCIRGRPEARVLPSRTSLPQRFITPLPILQTIQPVRSEENADYYDLAVRSAKIRILPDMETEVWGYGGFFPGPTFEASRGRRIVLRLRNELSVPIVNHLHGGRNAPENDGYPTDLILPVNRFAPEHMHDPLAHTAEREREYNYPNQQRAATLWYHDHRMDFTAPQMWRGLAGFYILRDEEERGLPLPRGDKEIALLICDRSFNEDGSLLYPSLDPLLLGPRGVSMEYMGGVLGDVLLVNGAPWPVLEVANTKYRFRVLNASNARRYQLSLDPHPSSGPQFLQIGSDGGLLSAPVAHRNLWIAPAERFDLIVDFSKFPMGSRIILRNRADSGSTDSIMQFHMTRHERDESVIPAKLSNINFPDPAEAAITRVFDFSYKGARGWTINGKPFDPARMDARPKLGATEIWQLRSDFSHPLHLHLVHFQILSHSGLPEPFDAGWKDTVDLGPGETANVLAKFEGYCGRYVFHCHNLEHEDMSMMGNFEVV